MDCCFIYTDIYNASLQPKEAEEILVLPERNWDTGTALYQEERGHVARLETHRLEVDARLPEYMGTTVVFRIWHHELDAPSVHIRLDRAIDEEGSPYVRCGLRAKTADRSSRGQLAPTSARPFRKLPTCSR